MSDATYHAAILPSRMKETNKQYLWESGQWGSECDKNFYGLQNPHADYHYNRILFLPERRGVLVCWVNVQEDFKVDVFVNSKEYMTFDEARELWNKLINPKEAYSTLNLDAWIRNDDVPPRKIHPDATGSGWGKAPRQTPKYNMIH
tara:strand:- start:27 stop:464 length:438 start_codon:yes stop_codon:yes gene_type:complete